MPHGDIWCHLMVFGDFSWHIPTCHEMAPTDSRHGYEALVYEAEGFIKSRSWSWSRSVELLKAWSWSRSISLFKAQSWSRRPGASQLLWIKVLICEITNPKLKVEAGVLSFWNHEAETEPEALAPNQGKIFQYFFVESQGKSWNFDLALIGYQKFVIYF